MKNLDRLVFPGFTTERLVIRPLSSDDYKEYRRAFQNTLPVLNKFLILLLFCLMNSGLAAAGFPSRTYSDGEQFYYKMTGMNDGRRYKAISRHKVERRSDNVFLEKVSWVYLENDEQEIDLSKMSDYVQVLSLDPKFPAEIPDISKIPPELRRYILGPIFDLMTFYVDLNPRLFQEKLDEITGGAKVRLPYNKPSSWADGNFILLGEDCLDFVVTLKFYGPERPCFRVEHLPPEGSLNINFPEPWMKEPVVEGKKNNWVQVTKSPDKGEYFVSYGYEYFDVHLYPDPETGIIKYAHMYNPVERMNLVSKNIKVEENVVTAIEKSSSATPYYTFREISIELMKDK